MLGRPSTKFRKIQVFAVFLFWSSYLLRCDMIPAPTLLGVTDNLFNRGNKHGPPIIRKFSSRLSKKLSVWQTTVMVFLWLYICRNFAKIVGLECPEPLANLYSRSFFRATWITTALDAGFWTAMNVKPKWLRDISSLVFTGYYLFAAEQADEKVRRVRATMTVEHLRVSWNKATTPYLWALAAMVRPRLTRYPPRAMRIPRPGQSSYTEPTNAWLYFDGPLSTLRDQTSIILDIPGGGYVAMSPRTSEDRLLAWAGKTKMPILSLDYKKAPEYPYPYALNECYDVYHMIVSTRGRCVGLSGQTRPRIVLTGDSAGANLAVGTTLMALQSGGANAPRWQGENILPRPDGLVLAYPTLSMKVESWMTEEQMALIQEKSTRRTNQSVLQRKSMDYHRLTPFTSPGPSVTDLQSSPSPEGDAEEGIAKEASKIIEEELAQDTIAAQAVEMAENQPKQIRTRLAVSSMISYVHDRMLTPEIMRALIILYIGPHNRPDFSADFLLSPVLAPDALLSRFPKTYIITGERDPLVDDTVIFAGRLRQAKLHQFRERQELGLEKSWRTFKEKDHVEVSLLPGVSHGFLQMAGLFPESWKHINRCASWIQDLFEMAERKKASPSFPQSLIDTTSLHKTRNATANNERTRNHKRSLTGESSADEDKPLEMGIGRMTPLNPDHGQHGHARIRRSFSSSAQLVSQEIHSDNDVPRSRSVSRGRTPRASGLARKRRFAPTSLKMPSVNGYSSDGPESPASFRRRGSLDSLSSEEDLLHRRMTGIAGGLMGIGERAQTP